MGWIGFGALLVSASYILYKHPPYSWDFGPWRCSEHRNAPLTPALPAARQIPETDIEPEPKPQNEPCLSLSQLEMNSTERSLSSDDGGPNDATPKVSAISTPPMLDIPILNLDETSTGPKTPDILAQVASYPIPTASGSPRAPEIRPPPFINPSISMPPPPPPQNLSALVKPAGLMPPPPRPSSRVPLRPPPSAASSLRAPPSCTPAGSKLSSSTLSPLGLPGKPQRSSRQVMLEPGHSPLDWAALTADPRNNLRGKHLPPGLIRVTPSMLKLHNGRKGYDAWTSYQGKVYNITPYLPFHPGGKGELLRGAGKDSAKLFLEVHPWVNWDGMLGECMVGILVSEHEPEERTGSLDEMD
ncbi:hypothetical protein DIZ76_014446 [Coccidioides immitis]|nr:hypothetical protein DIZ76_014446 [Coccidioides immitis]